MRVYLAAPIFSEADQMYNEYIAQRIEDTFPGVELYVPQRNKSINDKTKCADSKDICKGDFNDNLDIDDIVVALLDGNAAPGIGTTLEVGYFARICQEEINKYGSTKKRIIGLYTDIRECSKTVNQAKVEKLNDVAECQMSYLNLLLVGAVKQYGVLCTTVDDVIKELKNIAPEYCQEYVD